MIILDYKDDNISDDDYGNEKIHGDDDNDEMIDGNNVRERDRIVLMMAVAY